MARRPARPPAWYERRGAAPVRPPTANDTPEHGHPAPSKQPLPSPARHHQGPGHTRLVAYGAVSRHVSGIGKRRGTAPVLSPTAKETADHTTICSHVAATVTSQVQTRCQSGLARCICVQNQTTQLENTSHAWRRHARVLNPERSQDLLNGNELGAEHLHIMVKRRTTRLPNYPMQNVWCGAAV